VCGMPTSVVLRVGALLLQRCVCIYDQVARVRQRPTRVRWARRCVLLHHRCVSAMVRVRVCVCVAGGLLEKGRAGRWWRRTRGEKSRRRTVDIYLERS
jgi:hypothetical protein